MREVLRWPHYLGGKKSALQLMKSKPASKWTVGICDTQPVASAGVAALLADSPDFVVAPPLRSLTEAQRVFRSAPSTLLIIDKAFGGAELLAILNGWSAVPGRPRFIIWGPSFSAAEVMRFLQAGANGVLERSAPASSLMGCLQAVARGELWVGETTVNPAEAVQSGPRGLTPREQEIRELVEQGLKNWEIANRLGICIGTVKIHVKHIFEKTGLRSRYGLALAALRIKDSSAGVPQSP